MEITNLQVNSGDCYIIKEKNKVIIIDSGTSLSFKKIEKELKEREKIDLLIITHIDGDHIGGLLKLVKKNADILKKIDRIWFNCFDLNIEAQKKLNLIIPFQQEEKTIAQGISFTDILKKIGKLEKNKKYGDYLNLDDLQIEVLAPFDEELSILFKNWKDQLSKENELEMEITNKTSLKNSYSKDIDDIDEKYEEDDSIFNKSSIVILIKNKDGKTVLFTGDTTSSILIKALKLKGFSKENKLKLDLLKLPHHGSKKNLNKDFLDMIDCKKYILSTNGAVFKHPDKESISRIIKNIKDLEQIYTNYEVENFFTQNDILRKYDNLMTSQEKIII